VRESKGPDGEEGVDDDGDGDGDGDMTDGGD